MNYDREAIIKIVGNAIDDSLVQSDISIAQFISDAIIRYLESLRINML